MIELKRSIHTAKGAFSKRQTLASGLSTLGFFGSDRSRFSDKINFFSAYNWSKTIRALSVSVKNKAELKIQRPYRNDSQYLTKEAAFFLLMA